MDFDFLQQGAMLAPMAGVTDMPFRVICHEMGCPMAVSEMVSAKGYLLSPKGNRAAQELLSVDESERVRSRSNSLGMSRMSWRARRKN